MASPGSTTEKGQKKFSIAKNGMQILLGALGIGSESPVDYCNNIPEPLLVAIDFENTFAFREWLTSDSNFQAGLAILDTRNLRPPLLSLPPDKAISSWNFVCGSSDYYERPFRKFLFGTPVKIEREALSNKLISTILGDGSERRNVILVGHGVGIDLLIWSHLGFDFQEVQVSAVLDTSNVRAEFPPFRNMKLCELLDELPLPYNRLHNGGNDANFTLRCLLLLAVKYVRSKGPPLQDEDMLGYLEAISYAPYY